ncbi:leukotriene A-4 hydrolase-like isoform X1 [Temnothorax americanus]|uniref:leukotriene A-4 hydrolase-like isoform X1 n=1 Tax=Temnothorax americanus TaxID=1964332 RepID=UPI0040689E16
MNFYRKVLKGKAILTIDKTTLCDEVIIKIPNVDSTGGMRVSNKHKIQIKYETNSNSPALYWLKLDKTSNGTHPLLISTSKLTCTRAIFPCQDTPSRKITFDSEIYVPMGFNAMTPGFFKREVYENNRVIYIFSVTPNIPSYAMYIIVGSLEEVKILGRCAHVSCNL